ncbi:MAG: hemerythrin domain-containing protein [Acidobacteriota bacterium]|nr:hemerythrin domain-containing protein [Acidobacteriota bacterium]
MVQIGVQSTTIDTPIEHLVACHRRIEQRLDTLVAAADRFPSDRASAMAAIEKSLHFLDTNGVLHTEDEEVSLFPRLRPRLRDFEKTFVDSLEDQHQEAERIYTELKTLAADLSAETLSRYRERAEVLRALYRKHIQSEDEILTALARRTLTGDEIREVSREMRARRHL